MLSSKDITMTGVKVTVAKRTIKGIVPGTIFQYKLHVGSLIDPCQKISIIRDLFSIIVRIYSTILQSFFVFWGVNIKLDGYG